MAMWLTWNCFVRVVERVLNVTSRKLDKNHQVINFLWKREHQHHCSELKICDDLFEHAFVEMHVSIRMVRSQELV